MPNARACACLPARSSRWSTAATARVTSSTSVRPMDARRSRIDRRDHLRGRTAGIRRRDFDPQASIGIDTSRTMPSSTIEIAGTSGSGTSASASQTRSAVERRPPRGRGSRRQRAAVTASVVVSPLRARVGALQELHLGEQMAEMLGVHALLAAAARDPASIRRRHRERRFARGPADRREPRVAQRARIRRDAALRSSAMSTASA